jgi:putative ATPase
MSLFDEGGAVASMSAPLAVRMRPSSIDEVVGQQQALGEGSALRGLLTGARSPQLALNV